MGELCSSSQESEEVVWPVLQLRFIDYTLDYVENTSPTVNFFME